jgi:hypothetical protein
MIALMFRIIMPIAILFIAILAYRQLWIRVLKPILDKEKIDDDKQTKPKQHDDGGERDESQA